MDDKQLADRIVALGVGWQGKYPLSCDGVGFYHEPTDGEGLCAEYFVRDWRVAGALMEKVTYAEAKYCASKKWRTHANVPNMRGVKEAFNESLPRAICEACVEALQGDDE